MFVGNVVRAGCQAGMILVLAKLGTPASVGQYVLALAITTPVMALLMLQLRAVQATDAKGEYRFGDYLALRLAMMALALAVIPSISLLSGHRRETALVIIVVAFSAGIDAVSDVVYGLLQQRERMDRIAQSMMLKGIVSLAAVAVAMLGTNRVIYAVLAMAAMRLAVLIAWDLASAAGVLRGGSPLAERGTRDHGSLLPRWDARRLLALAQLSLPLGLVMMLITLSSRMPQYFVEHHLGEYWLGIFGALGLFGFVGTTAVTALGHSASPRLAQYYARGQTGAYCVLLLKLAACGAVIGAAGVAVTLLAGRPILTIVYGPEYAEHTHILVWTMVAAAVSYVASFVGFGITAARYFRIQMPLFALVAATTAGACFWLVPGWGLMGAALSLSVAALAQLVGSLLIVLHAVRRQSIPCPARSTL